MLEIPDDATFVQFGVELRGPLKAWLDDVSIEILGDGDPDSPSGHGPWNGDFETNAPGEAPWAWYAPVLEYERYPATTSDESPHGGSRCGRLESTLDERSGRYFGMLSTHLDATPYRGRLVEFRAWLRVHGNATPFGASQALVAVRRPNARVGWFERVEVAPIEDDAWQEVVLRGFVHEDAASVRIDFVASTDEGLAVDDVTLEVVGDPEFAPPRPLDDRGLENLVGLARLFGVVRYFHPSDEAAATDWDALALDAVDRVERAADAAELAAALRETFVPVAPTLRVFPPGEPDAPHPALALDPDARGRRVQRWEHRGVGPKSSPIYHSRLRRRMVRRGELPDGYRDPADAWLVDLGDDLVAAVPVTLFRDREGTLPRTEATPGEPTRFASGDDRTTRLADVILAWNVLQHFYPYFDEVEVDWAAELTTALRAAAVDEDADAFRQTLRTMIAALHDGHGAVALVSAGRMGTLPIGWAWIEDQLVVTTSAHPEVEVGMVVEHLDDVAAIQRIREIERRVSGSTPAFVRMMAVLELSIGHPGDTTSLILRAASGRRTRVALEFGEYDVPPEPRPETIAELEPGILYLDVDRATDEDLEARMDDLAAARAVVVDFRGYPSGLSLQFLAHFASETMTSPLWCTPRVLLPDQQGIEFPEGPWQLDPIEPRFEGRLVFVADERAISYAETCLQIVEHHELGPIVGRTTAGTNGNVNRFELPGGYLVHWTGMKTKKQDGSVFHGVGVRPTHPVDRTLEGVRAGRDELLEAALELARQ
ncbi:MAG: S41 family peptidase [Planctomycetota bacterium]